METGDEQLRLGREASNWGDGREALERLLAEAGAPQAQAIAGSIYSVQSHRPFDAQDVLGDAERGQWAWWEREDFPEAVRWLTLASERGIGPVSHNLAMHRWAHRDGPSEEEARERARPFLRRGYDQGFGVFTFDEDDLAYSRRRP